MSDIFNEYGNPKSAAFDDYLDKARRLTLDFLSGLREVSPVEIRALANIASGTVDVTFSECIMAMQGRMSKERRNIDRGMKLAMYRADLAYCRIHKPDAVEEIEHRILLLEKLMERDGDTNV